MVGWGAGERGYLVILPVHMPSLCTSLAVVKCVCEGTLVVSEWSGPLCVTPCDG